MTKEDGTRLWERTFGKFWDESWDSERKPKITHGEINEEVACL